MPREYVSKYVELNDREWLYQKYVNEGLSTVDIGVILGRKSLASSVRQALLKFGIPVRNLSDAQTCKFDDGLILNDSVLTGALLGDGQLRCYNPDSECSYPCFKKKNKYYDHIVYVSNFLFGNTERVSEVLNEYHGNWLKYFEIRSRANKKLLPLFKKWYPKENSYKKVVPGDINLDKTALLHWFLDDGYSIYIKGAKYRTVFAVFCSESFTIEEQQMLCKRIKDGFDINAKLLPVKGRGTGYRIKIPPAEICKLFEIIGPPPVDSLAYKWKLPPSNWDFNWRHHNWREKWLANKNNKLLENE